MALVPVTGLASVPVMTAAAWTASTVVVPTGVICVEGDTNPKKFKIGDGTKIYSELPYAVEYSFTAAYKALLDNANTAGGVVLTDSNNKIPLDLIPLQVQAKPVFVADIDARDAIPVEQRNSVIIVADASDDPTVTAGMAGYAWDGTAFLKLFEQESLDFDFTDFVKQGDALDRLADSANFVKMTPAERADLANAMLVTRQYFIQASTAYFTA